MSKIILVNPPTMDNAYQELKRFAFMAAPLGIAYIAAYLKEKNVSVDIIDSDPLGLDIEGTVQVIRKKKPEYVGVTAMTATMGITENLVREIRHALPDVVIILGGVHATVLPRRTMEEISVLDVVVVGEGEHTMYELIKTMDAGSQLSSLRKVDGIFFRMDGKIFENNTRPIITDLNSLPFPARDLLPMEAYEGPGWFRWCYGYTKPYVSVFTARGCPYNCNFCASHVMTGRKVRYRSIENVMAEIDQLKEEYDIKILSVEDDTFTLNKKRAIAICEELIKRDYKLNVICETRVDQINEELLSYMKKAGVKWLFFGVESGNQEVLDKTRKGINLDQIRRAFQLTKKAGINSHAGFIIGHLGETKKSAMDTIKFLKGLKPDHAAIATLVPFPGSRVWDYCQENNIPLPQDWNDYGMVNSVPISVNPNLSPKELIQLRDKAIMSYFANPGRIWKIFWKYNKRLLIQDHLYNAYALALRKIRLNRKISN